MGIILRTQAIGVSKRGSYIKYYTAKEKVKDWLGIEKTVKTRMQQVVPACEAVIFKCPWDKCGKRNEQSLLNSKGVVGDALSFNCCKCGREIEVTRPAEKPADIIVPGIDRPKPFALVDSFGRPFAR